MTLLFFLRSPAGNTDTGSRGDGADYPVWDDGEKPKRKTKAEKRAEKLAEKKLLELAQMAAAEQQKRIRRKRNDEEMLMLFMHEFEDEYEH